MSELFTIPETPSPRLLWMRKHKLVVFKSPTIDVMDEPWTAHARDADILDEEYATGKTEDEAIVNWAKKYGVKLWNEE